MHRPLPKGRALVHVSQVLRACECVCGCSCSFDIVVFALSQLCFHPAFSILASYPFSMLLHGLDKYFLIM